MGILVIPRLPVDEVVLAEETDDSNWPLQGCAKWFFMPRGSVLCQRNYSNSPMVPWLVRGRPQDLCSYHPVQVPSAFSWNYINLARLFLVH